MEKFKRILVLFFMFLKTNGIAQTYNVDTSFNAGNAGVGGGYVQTMLKRPDGKIIIAGSFTTYNGVSCKNMARLNADGTLDTSFDVGNGISSNSSFVIKALEIDQDGKILAGGFFTSFNGFSRRCLVRLNTDGSVDTTFSGSNLIAQVGAFEDRMIYSIKVDTNGNILIAGRFKVTSGSTILYDFIRLGSNGAFDSTFNTTTNELNQYSYGYDIKFQSNGKMLVAVLNNFYRPIIRFNGDGSFDSSFLGSTFEGFGAGILVLPDDKILLGGGIMRTISGGSYRTLLKLNADGSVDPTFTIYIAESGSSDDNCVYSIKMQDDKILIGGNMTTYGGVANNRITRLNNDGTPDVTFNIGTGPNYTISKIDLDISGKILLCGYGFTSFNGVTGLRGIARLGEGELSVDSALLPKGVSFVNNANTYSFHSLTENISDVYIFNIDGKTLHEAHAINSFDYSSRNDYPKGIHVIKVVTSDKKESIFKTIN